MVERDFQVDGREFKLNKIDPFKQTHIVRRLGPILGDIIPVAQKLQKQVGDSKTEDQKLESIFEVLQPLLVGFSKLSDEDFDKVFLGLLNAVEVKQAPAGNWARVARDGMLMMQDLDLPVLFRVAGMAFAYNLSGFFRTAPQISQGGA